MVLPTVPAAEICRTGGVVGVVSASVTLIA
jgi:hypothetical protein